ncbi:MAG: hypothetical protein WCI81_02975 [Chlorobiaceae bacterium]
MAGYNIYDFMSICKTKSVSSTCPIRQNVVVANVGEYCNTHLQTSL